MNDDYEWEREEDDDEDVVSGAGYTVSMRGAPNMATVQWTATEMAALEKTAREWGCKVDQLYIYRGQSE
jgi:hypothetical protein